MNKQLEKLYAPLVNEDGANNPFITPEINKKHDDFFNTYFSTSVMTYQEYDTATTKFLDFVSAVEENAFEVGFYTALELMKGHNK